MVYPLGWDVLPSLRNGDHSQASCSAGVLPEHVDPSGHVLPGAPGELLQLGLETQAERLANLHELAIPHQRYWHEVALEWFTIRLSHELVEVDEVVVVQGHAEEAPVRVANRRFVPLHDRLAALQQECAPLLD